MQLIIISPPDKDCDEAGRVNALFDAGLEIYHLRKPGWNAFETEQVLSGIKPAYRNRVAIHDHHIYYAQWGISRLHFPEREQLKSGDKWPATISTDVILSTSVHYPDSLTNLSPFYSYSFCGPFFPSISKPGYHPRVNWKEKRMIRGSLVKLVALGGIDEYNIREVAFAGFECAAVLGAIWCSEDPVEKFRSFLNTIQKVTAKEWKV